MKLSEAPKRVITLARKIRRYYDVELPKWYPDYPVINPAQEGPPLPKEEGELSNFLRSLPAETIYRLLLIMYLGRGWQADREKPLTTRQKQAKPCLPRAKKWQMLGWQDDQGESRFG